VIRANYALRAIELPAGTHTVVFKYQDRWFFIGSVITVISALIVATVVVVAFAAKKKKKDYNREHTGA
jgi:uncharacterized membrane protein YfhO